MARRVLFLPGAGGAPEFWHPVGALLPEAWEKRYLGWPGLGVQAHDPEVRSLDDLVRLTADELDGATDLVAQSMGGVVAARVALAHQERVRRLVLVATSGGVDVAALGGVDWRDDYRRDFPDAAAWITEERPDHTEALCGLETTTLLVWGDADPISPPAVGAALAMLLPNSRLHVLPDASHDLAVERADEVAALVAAHLAG